MRSESAMVDAIVQVVSEGDKLTQVRFSSKEAAPTRSLSYGHHPKTGEKSQLLEILWQQP